MNATHEEIQYDVVKHFLALKLSYLFTATLTDTNMLTPTVRFQFSKPTKETPVPAITVTADVKLIQREGSTYSYSFLAEGQRFNRIITINASHVTGHEFNEEFLDKVFLQKERLRSKHMWSVS